MTNGGLYRVGPFVAVAGFLALLAGCGRFGILEQRDPWRAEAELQCLQAGLVKPSVFVQPRSAINGPGVCGMEHPFQVMAYAGGAVAVSQKLTLGCPMVSRADQWLAEVVQPAAQQTYGSSVVEIRSGSYSCRPRNNQRGARLSEHSFGNAMDVFSFKFDDGREVVVKTGWRGQPDEQQFLRQVFTSSCQYFTTVLGPGADMFHYDHFHLDLARHDPRGLRSICKPVIKYEPLPGEGRVDRPLMSFRAPASPQPTTAVASGGLAPRGSIPNVPPATTPVYSRSPAAIAAPAPGAGYAPPRLAASASPARPAGSPINLAPPMAAAPSAGAQPESEGEIDADHDPYAVDD